MKTILIIAISTILCACSSPPPAPSCDGQDSDLRPVNSTKKSTAFYSNCTLKVHHA